jgi:FlaA1/EpsC-like NDP-sugar epimerase
METVDTPKRVYTINLKDRTVLMLTEANQTMSLGFSEILVTGATGFIGSHIVTVCSMKD